MRYVSWEDDLCQGSFEFVGKKDCPCFYHSTGADMQQGFRSVSVSVPMNNDYYFTKPSYGGRVILEIVTLDIFIM